jgi:hypothetical protein
MRLPAVGVRDNGSVKMTHDRRHPMYHEAIELSGH